MQHSRIAVALACVAAALVPASVASQSPARAATRPSGHEYPAESWKAATSAESLGWSPARVAVVRANVAWDVLLGKVLTARLR